MGRLAIDLKIGIKHGPTQDCVTVGLLGWAHNPSWTHANLAAHLTSCKVHKVHTKKPFGQPRKKQEAHLHVCKCTPTPKERLERQLVDINKSQWGTKLLLLVCKDTNV